MPLKGRQPSLAAAGCVRELERSRQPPREARASKPVVNDSQNNPSYLNASEAAAEDFLYRRVNYEKQPPGRVDAPEFRFETIRILLERLGDPQLQYPIIHVAGTKGKGSVSCMISSIIEKAGFRTGLYTSPHLCSVRERFRVDQTPISRNEFVDSIEFIRPWVEALDQESLENPVLHPPTFFEITTVLAFLHFANQKVDFGVIEVGMGGRLDSTNICQSDVSVITNIHFDHMDQLGDTLESIAAEKAGIIKHSVPVVCGDRNQNVIGVIEGVASQANSPMFLIDRDFGYQLDSTEGSQESFDFHSSLVPGKLEVAELNCGMSGRHQIENATLAIAASQMLFERTKPGAFSNFELAVREGLATASLAGRYQWVEPRTIPETLDSQGPSFILDIAHNESAASALRDTLVRDNKFARARRKILVFASSRGKRVDLMLSALAGEFDEVILTRFESNPRSLAPQTVAEAASDYFDDDSAFRLIAKPPEVLQWIGQDCGPEDLVCVTGSAFLVGEFLELLGSWPDDQQGLLQQDSEIHG